MPTPARLTKGTNEPKGEIEATGRFLLSHNAVELIAIPDNHLFEKVCAKILHFLVLSTPMLYALSTHFCLTY